MHPFSLKNPVFLENTKKFLLDQFPGSIVGYSLRSLTKYKGDVIRVRRGNEEKSFSEKDRKNGNLLNWVNISGNANGYINTWYDQNVPTTNQSMYFNGTNNFVEGLAPAIPETDDFYISLDYFSSIQSSTSDIVSQYNLNPTEGRFLLENLRGNLRLFIGSSGGNVDIRTTGLQLNNKKFFNIQTKRVNNDFSLYLDNELIGTQNRSISIYQDKNFIVGKSLRNFEIQGSAKNIFVSGVLKWEGLGNNNENWKDQIGSNDGSISGDMPRRVSSLNLDVLSNDIIQNITGNQPLIVESGLLITENNNQAMYFDGMTNSLSNTFQSNISQPLTFVAVASLDPSVVNDNNTRILCDGTDVNNRCIFFTRAASNPDSWAVSAGVQSFSSIPTNSSQTLWFSLFDGVSSQFFINSETASTDDAGTDIINGIRLGSRFDGTLSFWKGTIQEFIIYSGDNIPLKNKIESNINSYYKSF